MSISEWLKTNTCDLSGKTVAITGATGGIGKELCCYLAKLNANLILLNRSKNKSEELKHILNNINSEISVTIITVNLEDFYSVVAACEQLKVLPVDILIHNAGAYSIPKKITTLGYNNVFQINFVSAYYITKELLPFLEKRKNSKVVVVGSIAYNYIKSDQNNCDYNNLKKSSLIYGNSKRYLMFSFYKLFENTKNVKLSVCHPGITFTNITSHYQKIIFALIKRPMKIIFIKPKKAALSILKGCFDFCGFNQWIGPKVLNVWGFPSKKTITNVTLSETNGIYKTAEEIYKKIKSKS